MNGVRSPSNIGRRGSPMIAGALPPRDISLMRQQTVGQAIGPVEGRQFLDRGVGLKMEERQGVIPTVPPKRAG